MTPMGSPAAHENPRGRVAGCRDGVAVGCRRVPVSPSRSGPRRCAAPGTVGYRPRYSTRRIFLAVSASPSCAVSEGSMEVLYPVCCALDVHQASVTACLRAPGDGLQRRQQVRTFGTTTPELLRLAGWLTAAGCTHVAMESTGIYWRPVYNILEGSFELSVVNAQHVKMVPGRKTDVRDSEWLAQLLELGLLRRSFVPPAAQRELRDVVRHRKRLIEERAREANRVQKVLPFAVVGHEEHTGPREIAHHGDVVVPALKGLLVHPNVAQLEGSPPLETAGDRAALDAPHRVHPSVSWRATAVTAASRSQSIVRRSNSSVNFDPGVAH